MPGLRSRQWGADALTVNPYQGRDAVQPFLDYADRGVFVLTRTSNPGSAEFQDLHVRGAAGEGPLYEEVARQAVTWNDNGNVGLVVGATVPDELARVRSIVGSMPILIPGIGAQGGDLEASVRNGTDGTDAARSSPRPAASSTRRRARTSRRPRAPKPSACATPSTRNSNGWASRGRSRESRKSLSPWERVRVRVFRWP